MPPTTDHQPERRAAVRLHIGTNRNSAAASADRQRGAADEEEGDRARIVDAGLDQALAQHLHGLARRPTA